MLDVWLGSHHHSDHHFHFDCFNPPYLPVLYRLFELRWWPPYSKPYAMFPVQTIRWSQKARIPQFVQSLVMQMFVSTARVSILHFSKIVVNGRARRTINISKPSNVCHISRQGTLFALPPLLLPLHHKHKQQSVSTHPESVFSPQNPSTVILLPNLSLVEM